MNVVISFSSGDRFAFRRSSHPFELHVSCHPQRIRNNSESAFNYVVFAASIAVGVSVSTSVSDGRHDQSFPRAKPVMFGGGVTEQVALKLLLAT